MTTNPEGLRELADKWEARARDAHPSDAMLINRHVRELREALAASINPVAVDSTVIGGAGDDGEPPMRGRMVTVDFEANTVTLEMIGRYYAAAGEFVLTPAARASTPEDSTR